ncbi:type II secretion system F family protein [Propylenella binzhouense]|uniref:Type II secretion system F family protein n=1 Tax=Propylenella binzhouense TaxID=2555902 RepID=A0A964T5C1_9HYPH|nr:type II secretion system F family protein [Propylenella binzhouense]MYZ48669.1 type II secretion system F family protein [Propylenella binzhouense]
MSPTTVQIAVILLAVFSFGGLAVAALYPRLSGASKPTKRLEHVAAPRSMADRRNAISDESRRRRSVEETLKEIEEKQKAQLKKSAKPSLAIRMRQAGLSWSKQTYYLVSLVSIVVVSAAVLVGTGIGLVPSVGFGVAGGLLLPYFYVNFLRKRRFKRFSEEFPNAVDVIVRGVKAGLPLVDCLKIIASESQEPVKSEFQTIVEDQTLGLPMDEAVGRLPERVPLAESNFFAIVIAIQSRTGGSLSEALSNLSKVLRDRKKMRAKIRAMSSEAKASAGIIGSLPIAVTVIVYLTSPDYIALLFTTTVGNIVLAACGFWMLMGVLVMRKMINFDF